MLIKRLRNGFKCCFGNLALIAAGFCIHGTQSLILIVVSNMVTKRVATVANGFIGLWCYEATIIIMVFCLIE